MVRPTVTSSTARTTETTSSGLCLHGKDRETEQELLSVLRDRSNPTAAFRGASDRLARLISCRFLSRFDGSGSSDRESTSSTARRRHDHSGFLIVPIMRAGLALVPAFTELMPAAPVGMVGMQRDEDTAEASLYYEKLPEVPTERALIIDPMLATGGSACVAASLLTGLGYESSNIYFVGVLAAPEGIERLSRVIPRPNIVVAAVDQGLDENYFIVPGLGDYGDRYYGT